MKKQILIFTLINLFTATSYAATTQKNQEITSFDKNGQSHTYIQINPYTKIELPNQFNNDEKPSIPLPNTVENNKELPEIQDSEDTQLFDINPEIAPVKTEVNKPVNIAPVLSKTSTQNPIKNKPVGQVPLDNKVYEKDIKDWNNTTINEIELKANEKLNQDYIQFLNAQ